MGEKLRPPSQMTDIVWTTLISQHGPAWNKLEVFQFSSTNELLWNQAKTAAETLRASWNGLHQPETGLTQHETPALATNDSARHSI